MTDHDQNAIAQSPQNERRSCRHCGAQYWTLDVAHQCVGSVIDELMRERRMVEIERAAAERSAGERDALRAERDEAKKYAEELERKADKLELEKGAALARVKEAERKRDEARAEILSITATARLATREEIKQYETGKVFDHIDHLKADNERLEESLRKCAEHVGAVISPGCSLEFHCSAEGEVGSVVAKMKADNASAWTALGECTCLMDPPDGGEPTLAELIARMRQAWKKSEKDNERLRGLLKEAHVCTEKCCQCIRLSSGDLCQRIEQELGQ